MTKLINITLKFSKEDNKISIYKVICLFIPKYYIITLYFDNINIYITNNKGIMILNFIFNLIN